METTVEPTTTERAAKAAHDAIDRMAARGGIAELRARRASMKVAEQSREVRHNMNDYVNQHPVASLAMAAAAGFIVRALLRR